MHETTQKVFKLSNARGDTLVDEQGDLCHPSGMLYNREVEEGVGVYGGAMILKAVF